MALLVATLAGWMTVRETRRWRTTPFGDFNYLQTGAECLMDGCNPYDSAALNAEAAARHEAKPNIQPTTPVYPPSTLLLLTPFSRMGWPTAAYVFDGLAGLATAVACVLIVWRLRIGVGDAGAVILVAGLVCLPMASALEFGNPVLLAAAFTAIACLLLLQREFTSVGWVLLGVSLALKPQLALGALAVLLWKRETRWAAVKAGGLAAIVLAAGLVAYRLRLGSVAFLATLERVLRMSIVPGGSSDFANKDSFEFLNLQTFFARIANAPRAVVNALAWLTTAGLAAAACWLAIRTGAVRRRPWTMIALATAVSLLPVYHRGYDRVIAVVLVPAAAEIRSNNKSLAWLYAVVVTLWIANDTVMSHVFRRWHYIPQNGMEDVAFCVVLLVSLWWQRQQHDRTVESL